MLHHATKHMCSPWVMLATLVLFAGTLTAHPAAAASNANAKILLHLLTPTSKAQCTRSDAAPICTSAITTGDLYPQTYFAYLLVGNGDAVAGFAGMQCGIQYNGAPGAGIDVFSWTLCATLDFSSTGWPASGGGDLITWDSTTRCQRTEPGGPGTGVVGVAGYFYMAAYTPDQMRITPRPVDGKASLASCSAQEFILVSGTIQPDPSPLGYATFSSGASMLGYNPCAAGSGTLDCSIVGPATVLPGAMTDYSAPNVPAGASRLWSITGDGAILGGVTGPSVTVSSPTTGSFLLSLMLTEGLVTSTCTRLVSVMSPTCVISGPATIIRDVSVGYSVATNLPAPTVTWTATGDYTNLVPNGPLGVTVSAGSTVGAIELTAHINSTLADIDCSRTINVIDPPACLISGPASIGEGTTGNGYTVTYQGVQSYNWSVTGPAAISAGQGTSNIHLTATDPGGIELTVMLTLTNGAQLACSLPITATPFNCEIGGPSTIPNPGSAYNYSVAQITEATYAWSISGDASILSLATVPVVTVLTGQNGSFLLEARITRHSVTRACTKLVTITPGTTCPPNPYARLLLHLLPTTPSGACTRGAALPACTEVNVTGGLYPLSYFAHLLVMDATTSGGVAGLECGISYDTVTHQGVDVFSWTLCASLEFPSGGWPAAGGGNLITWDSATKCQRYVPPGNDPQAGIVANAGYFYLSAYSPDQLKLTPRPVSGFAKIADCGACETALATTGGPEGKLGFVGFGGAGGYNPCLLPAPVVSTTWSHIKAIYGQREAPTYRNGQTP